MAAAVDSLETSITPELVTFEDTEITLPVSTTTGTITVTGEPTLRPVITYFIQDVPNYEDDDYAVYYLSGGVLLPFPEVTLDSEGNVESGGLVVRSNAGAEPELNLFAIPSVILNDPDDDDDFDTCLLYTSPSPRDRTRSRMPSSA